jgi:hypothetical protein
LGHAGPSGPGQATSDPLEERLVLLGHLPQQRRRGVTRSELARQVVEQGDRAACAEAVEPGQRTAAVGCETEAENGPDLGVPLVAQDAFLQAARGLETLGRA